jgi:hypothetical protein
LRFLLCFFFTANKKKWFRRIRKKKIKQKIQKRKVKRKGAFPGGSSWSDSRQCRWGSSTVAVIESSSTNPPAAAV